MTQTECKVLFEDTHLIVLDKPAGLLSQGASPGDPNVVDWLRTRFGRPYVGLVHRLDRNTSGIMIVAKRTKSARRLSEALQRGKLTRTYIAWLVGEVLEPQTWTHFLLKDNEKNLVSVLNPNDPRLSKSQKAQLSVAPVSKPCALADGTIATLVRFILETGRSHQIRVQSASQGHPILGDPKYGKNIGSKIINRPALHSETLRFPHPISGEFLEFKAELPSDFKSVNS